MNFTSSRCIDGLFDGSGAIAYGIVRVGPVDGHAIAHYGSWIAAGKHGAMGYLDRYHEVRNDPTLLLHGARSMICCAFPYPSPLRLPPMKVHVAAYALGNDYHEVVRRRLNGVAARIAARYGGDTRVCVDTAPLRERYWAMRAGLGFIGRNNHLIIPGLGSNFFLGEIITTAELPETPRRDQPRDACGACTRCADACPAKALAVDGSGADARRCLSYLTIEHRGPLPDGTDLHGCLYGCDICAAVCPCNITATPVEPLPEFKPRESLLRLSPDDILGLSQQQFSALFAHSAIKRAKLAGLSRNAVLLAQSGS